MTFVRHPRVKTTDHVLSMDPQDIFVRVHLDILALIVKVRNDSYILFYMNRTKSQPFISNLSFCSDLFSNIYLIIMYILNEFSIRNTHFVQRNSPQQQVGLEYLAKSIRCIYNVIYQ